MSWRRMGARAELEPESHAAMLSQARSARWGQQGTHPEYQGIYGQFTAFGPQISLCPSIAAGGAGGARAAPAVSTFRCLLSAPGSLPLRRGL